MGRVLMLLKRTFSMTNPITKHLTRLALVGLCVMLTLLTILSVTPVSADTGFNWLGQYWNNNSLSGNPTITRTDPIISFNWGSGSPDAAIPADNFSARWTLTQNFLAGAYRFRAGAEDGIRVFIDDVQVLNQFNAVGSFQVYTTDVNLGAGNHNLRVEYFAGTGLAGALFDWTPISAIGVTVAPNATAVPPPSPTMKAEVRVDTANVRSDPSTNNPPIAQIFFGDQFVVLKSNGDGTWYLIQLKDGRQGWVFRRNLYLFAGDASKLATSQAPAASPIAVPDVQAVARFAVIVRDGPSRKNTKKIGSLNEGESFKVLALGVNRAWVFISASGGLQGWVYVPYITVTVGDLGSLPRRAN